jgi:hypothetical protein
VILDYRTSKVLVVNEIELGISIPTIESRASKISRDEGNTYTGLIESWHHVHPICQYGFLDPAIDY